MNTFYIAAAVMLLLGLLQQFKAHRERRVLRKAVDVLKRQVDQRHAERVEQAEEAARELREKTDPADVVDDVQRTLDNLRAGRSAGKP